MNKTITNKAIFLDRDGVLIRDTHLITKWEQVEFFDGVKEAITLLKEMGYLLYILSNQSVVARGMLSEQECQSLHEKILDALGIRDEIEESYLCPYHPDAQVIEYKKEHPWRKPNTGAITYWEQRDQINCIQSFMIGDRLSDIDCGKKACCRTISIGDQNLNADFRFNSLLDFAIDLQNLSANS